MLQDRMNELKSELIEYATLVERMIDKSIRGLLDRERGLLVEVIEVDEPKANRTEIVLDDHCTTMIAQFEPRAKDLRTVLMVLRMNNDLERMGDHAVNIAESALYLIERPQVKPLIDIPKMAEESMKMLKDSITSFIEEDVGLARQVCEQDNTVDQLREQIMRELIGVMEENPSMVEPSFHLLRISGNLERLADLSTNVCEDVIFMSKGWVIKHRQEDDR